MELVWFKRDLRISDHSPLVAAAKRGPVICLYLYEPEIIQANDFSRRHLLFINDSLRELDEQLRKLGTRLIIRTGEAVAVLNQLHSETGFNRIRVHQETTNSVSFQRDLRVLDWARHQGIEVVEYRQQGIVRRLASRDGWAKQWQAFVSSPLVPAPRAIVDGSGDLASEGIQSPDVFNLADDGIQSRQQGGESKGKQVLASFLKERSTGYTGGLSSPVTAWDACSRLSPYLAYGNLSLRSVYQQTAKRRRERQRAAGVKDVWAENLTNFNERLAWHCHFMQKLEDEPRIEFENMNRAFDGLRENAFNQDHFQAWAEGRTGYPMIDACMRALIATGWINFRMRAMLISFASYDLWLHWREPALHLARLFVDYEPGIHYSQIQMQSGTTGIAALRVYSPIKQVRDQDPQGLFIKQWIPELADVPADYIAEPHTMPREMQQSSGCIIGQDYPAPIVDHASASHRAKQRMRKAGMAAKASGDSQQVFLRHGSRRPKASRGWGGPGNRRRG
jgi:deoxyribodipyrimidine photo-lyase